MMQSNKSDRSADSLFLNSGLPEPLLLDAAHIIADKDERLGHPVVPNGIPLSKIHHAAFDAHLIGIDLDYGVDVSDRLLSLDDGPMWEALKRPNNRIIHLLGRVERLSGSGPARAALRAFRRRNYAVQGAALLSTSGVAQQSYERWSRKVTSWRLFQQESHANLKILF